MINKKIVAVLVSAGALVVAGPASAHGRWHGGHGGGGGAVVGALIGGAVLGAIVSSALAPAPAYAAPAYAAPAYQEPAYQPAQYQYQQAYAGPPPGTCFDRYRNVYVACGPQPAPGYYQPPGW
ncbi:ecotin precursor [Burkholderia gladioli]|uniref:ecotin precursor n=1 Tax=Burkholderia gladioli TaxID=28095 RepID=UPI001640100D|nr:ecotin precursor [Burkholderia gladioli]MBU9169337.1 ecotin precursor [Burkholderia gladioli]